MRKSREIGTDRREDARSREDCILFLVFVSYDERNIARLYANWKMIQKRGVGELRKVQRLSGVTTSRE